MKICCIVSEFNPLHNGHARLIDYARKQADAVCCILNGNFAQRGMPACANKSVRAKWALEAGADAVLQLPTVFGIDSAQNFAFGAVKLAKQINADLIVFGSKCADLQILKNCVDETENEETNVIISSNIKKGMSYPQAVAAAMPQFAEILSCGNDTLALEYLRAAKEVGFEGEFSTLKRNDGEHGFATSSDIRSGKSISCPETVLAQCDFDVERRYAVFANSFLATADKTYLSQIEGVSEGLENLLCSPDENYAATLAKCKSKRYTQTKIQRAILAAALSVTKDLVAKCKTTSLPLRLLGIKQYVADELLAQIDFREADDDVFAEIESRADALYRSLGDKQKQVKLVKI